MLAHLKNCSIGKEVPPFKGYSFNLSYSLSNVPPRRWTIWRRLWKRRGGGGDTVSQTTNAAQTCVWKQSSCWTIWWMDMCFIWIEWSRHIKLWKKWNHSSDVWVRRRSILDKSGRKTINQIKMIFALSTQNRYICDGKNSWQWIRSQKYFSKEIIS